MQHFEVSLRFYPNQANPARASGRGVYRVIGCHGVAYPRVLRKIRVQAWIGSAPVLCITAARKFQHKSRVDPVKAALEYVRAVAVQEQAARFVRQITSQLPECARAM